MPSKYNALAARIRILERGGVAPDALLQGHSTTERDEYNDKQWNSFAIHRKHCVMLGKTVPSSGQALRQVRDSVSRRAYNWARSRHREAGSARHTPLPAPVWKPVRRELHSDESLPRLQFEAPAFFPAGVMADDESLLFSPVGADSGDPDLGEFDTSDGLAPTPHWGYAQSNCQYLTGLWHELRWLGSRVALLECHDRNVKETNTDLINERLEAVGRIEDIHHRALCSHVANLHREIMDCEMLLMAAGIADRSGSRLGPLCLSLPATDPALTDARFGAIDSRLSELDCRFNAYDEDSGARAAHARRYDAVEARVVQAETDNQDLRRMLEAQASSLEATTEGLSARINAFSARDWAPMFDFLASVLNRPSRTSAVPDLWSSLDAVAEIRTDLNTLRGATDEVATGVLAVQDQIEELCAHTRDAFADVEHNRLASAAALAAGDVGLAKARERHSARLERAEGSINEIIRKMGTVNIGLLGDAVSATQLAVDLRHERLTAVEQAAAQVGSDLRFVSGGLALDRPAWDSAAAVICELKREHDLRLQTLEDAAALGPADLGGTLAMALPGALTATLPGVLAAVLPVAVVQAVGSALPSTLREIHESIQKLRDDYDDRAVPGSTLERILERLAAVELAATQCAADLAGMQTLIPEALATALPTALPAAIAAAAPSIVAAVTAALRLDQQ